MNRPTVYLFGMIFIIGIAFSGYFIYTLQNEKADIKLTVYTYDSLLADPGYAFDRAFEKYAKLPNNSVQVVFLEDSGNIITRADIEKENPQADVLIGIDNANIGIAREKNILQAYKANGLDKLEDGLVDELAPDYLLTPYDYGVISLWYLNNKFAGSLNASKFNLSDLQNQTIANQLVVSNPALSSPGLGFLLHTIAVFGDKETGIDGVIDGDWEQFWSNITAKNYAKIVPSWGDAFDLLYTEESSRSMMVSYTTSPAYGNCLYNDNTTTSLLSNEGTGNNWGWRQIEGLGLVKNAPHEELGKKFIDWFIGDEVQSQIRLNQWMYPAVKSIQEPDCYDIVLPIDNIMPLNDYIPIEKLSANLDTWLDRWEKAVVLN